MSVQATNGFRELWRGVAKSWELDHMGHMNVQFYMQMAHEATGWLAHGLGVAPETLRPREQFFRFRREARAGDVLAITGGVVACAESRLEHAMELADVETGEAVTSIFTLCAPGRLDRGQAAALTGQWSGERQPRQPLPRPALADRADIAADRRDGFFDTHRGTVSAWECDRDGVLSTPLIMARLVQSVWHAGAAIGAGPGFFRAGHVSAGLYYHIRFHDLARTAERLEAVAAVVEVGASSHRFLHKLYAADGRLIASNDTVGIHIDPATRRPTPWPEAVGARARARLLKPAAGSMVAP